MKTKIIAILIILMCYSIQSQTNPVVENYALKAMEIVSFPFSREFPIPIGTISDSGELNFNFPKDIKSL